MEEVYLRMFREDDYILINKWRHDIDIQRLVSAPYRYVSLEIEKQWVASKMSSNKTDVYLAICVKSEEMQEQMVGYTSINDIDYVNRKAHLGGILIGEKKYHNGVVVYQAGLKMLELAFDHLNLNRLSASCLVEHKTSTIQIQARGFKLEGMYKQAIFKDGMYHDQYIFGILKEDFVKMREEGYYKFNTYMNRIVQLSTNK